MFPRSALAFALAGFLFAGLSPAHAQLPPQVAQVMQQHGIGAGEIGVLVLRGEEPVLAHQAELPMQPASTMKLVTTLVGLEKLGPAFRGRTELRTAGEIRDGVLRGDLVLKGGADADLSGEHIEDMLRALRYQGVQRIVGDLVLDRSLFQPTRPDIGLPPFDEAPEAYYNVIPDALLVNKNMLQLDLRAGAAGRLQARMHPELERVSVTSEMTLIDADCARWEDGWKLPEVRRQTDGRIEVVLRGTFPKNCSRSYGVNVLDRDDYVGRLVRQAWNALGGSWSGSTGASARAGATPPDARLLAAHVSRALPEIVRDTNKASDNALARTLFLSLGSLQDDPTDGSTALQASVDSTANANTASTFARADATVRAWLRAHAIDDSGFVIDNGSGLSRIERASALQLGYLLQAGLRSQWAPEFQASLPIGAVDGTLRRRLQHTPAAGRARLKTGALRNVTALAGYVPDANGEPCVFVAMVNSERAGEGRGRAVLDALVEWVARSGAVQPAPALPVP